MFMPLFGRIFCDLGTIYAKTWAFSTFSYGYEGFSPLNRTSSTNTAKTMSAGAVAGISIGAVLGFFFFFW
jgi:hypothetical protein